MKLIEYNAQKIAPNTQQLISIKTQNVFLLNAAFKKPKRNITQTINTSVRQVLSNKLKSTYTKYIQCVHKITYTTHR